MPIAKDMEFAKQLIAKEMISRAEIQRHLDDLDAMCQSGKNLSLEQLLVERKIISSQELRFMQVPKKRIVHCSKCNTMYRAREEDIGKKFKCKQCGIFVIVPLPGQTEVRSVKEIQQKAHPQLEQIDTQKVLKQVPKPLPASGAKTLQTEKAPTVPTTREMTMLLGLEEEKTEKTEAQVVSSANIPTDSKKQEKPEMTIMLDLDDEDEPEAIEIFPESLEFSADIVPEIAATIVDKTDDLKVDIKPDVESTEPEMTIMLDLDDEDESEEETVVEQHDLPDVPFVSKEDYLEAQEVGEIAGELDEWALSGYGGEGAEKVELKPQLPTVKPIENKPIEMDIPEELDEWAISGYGGEDAGLVEVETKIDETLANADAPVLSYQEMQALSKWEKSVGQKAEKTTEESGAKAAEGKKQVNIVTSVTKDEQKISPKGDEMTIVLDLDEDDDDDDNELRQLSAPEEKMPALEPKPFVSEVKSAAKANIVTPVKKDERKISPKGDEMTIVLGLDEEEDDDE